jgi:hypothetical protein
MIMDGEFIKGWKEKVVAYFKVPSLHSPEET